MSTSRNSCLLLFYYISSILCAYAATPDQQALLEALMDESLRSHRVQACDGERVTLSCPRNTHIIVETGFYGRVVPESQLCPGRAPSNRKGSYSGTCDVIQAQTRLSELCDKKRKCTVYVDTTTFEDDPCPSTSKYLQMSYKCKPISFDGESFCGGTEMQLSCRDGKRLAIYSATFGRTTRGQAAHCPTPPKHFSRDCTRDVLPSVLTQCHAKSGCSMSVSETTLGKPCDAQPYLNILFMCVNEEIFSEDAINGELPSLETYKKQFANGSNNNAADFEEDDEWEKLSERMDAVEKQTIPKPEPSVSEVRRVEGAKHQVHNDGTYVTEDRYSMRSSDGISDVGGLEAESQAERVEGNAVGIAHDLLTMATFFKENKEKVLICVVLMVAMALCLLITACIVMKCVGGKKQDPRVRYSIERSQLLSKSSPYSVLGGPPSLTDIGDLDSETFLRFSLTTPPRSSHYDF